jgi:hypothetical protein
MSPEQEVKDFSMCASIAPGKQSQTHRAAQRALDLFVFDAIAAFRLW